MRPLETIGVSIETIYYFKTFLFWQVAIITMVVNLGAETTQQYG
ncbi:protein of unknown function [Xenorhabdus bovienii]|uniref:Uncharacterized protein n=1 Tax=Xenorhabdus bovienii TaxID=40576 RepID=A0A0B6X817_XENBV|nr:protein of unknown function [Xenorhabdus bovienii]